MENDDRLLLRSVTGIPRWLMLACATLSSAAMLAGVALIVYGAGWAESGGELGGAIGGGLGCLIGGAGGMFGTLRDWRRRLPATALMAHVRADEVSPFYRRVFWPAVVALALGITAGALWNHRAIWHGVVQPSAILAFIAGAIEASRRHAARRARAVFARYADGSLDEADRAAIDAARADPAFERDLRALAPVRDGA